MTIAVGDRVPDVALLRLGPDGQEEVRTGEFLAGKKVVMFGVPGAFTPTCNNLHVPSYLEGAAELRESGVDAIVCVSVNDVFVMDAWAKSFGDDHGLIFVSDWDAALARAMGLDDDRGATLGVRFKRFAMVVDNGVVTTLNIEAGPGTIEKTAAAKLLMAI